MTSMPDGPLVGAQRPRVEAVPAFASSAGEEAIDFCESFGLALDPWQQYVLTRALGERRDGKWASMEVAAIVPRQNGKGGLLEAREIAGLFLFGEQLILHSAHEFKTSQEGFRRVLAHIEGSSMLRKRVRRVRTSHGEEGIELTTGARLRFVSRSTGSGRGFTGDTVILDEAFNLGADAMAALLPTLSARPNPQIWYTSSAGMEKSEQLRKVRARGLSGESARLAYFEWSAEPGSDPTDPKAWAQANPALGIRIAEEFIAAEQAALDPEVFGRERLGFFDEPGAVPHWQIVPKHAWQARGGAQGRPDSRVVFAIAAASPDAEWCSIAVAGWLHGELSVQIIRHQPGSSWVPEELARLRDTYRPSAIVLDLRSPADRLVQSLESARVQMTYPKVNEIAQAASMAFDGIAGDSPTWRHYDQPELAAAIAQAAKRPLGDRWTWQRSAVSSPLEAATLAAWGLVVYGSRRSAYADDDAELMVV